MFKCLEIATTQIKPDPDQPRRVHGTDEELARNLKIRGQLVPVIVIAEGSEYRLIDGQRRWQAASSIGLQSLKAVVVEKPPSTEELLAIQLSINSLRQDINAIDRMIAYRKLMELRGCNATELATFLGISKSSVTRVLALEKLSESMQELVIEGKISSSNAYAIARMEDATQKRAIVDLIKGRANREETEALASNQAQSDQRQVKRLTCQLPSASVLLRAPEPITLEGIASLCRELLRYVRRAKKEGYDVQTFARILQDKAKLEKEPDTCSSSIANQN